MLAEKGLPQSGKSGYELFNDLGSLGLTSFMQDITGFAPSRARSPARSRTLKGVKGRHGSIS